VSGVKKIVKKMSGSKSMSMSKSKEKTRGRKASEKE